MPKVVGFSQEVFKRVTCTHCGAINEYAPVEVQLIKYGHDYTGGYEVMSGIRCAQCSTQLRTN